MFSVRLKELRHEKGLTQKELSKILGVSTSSIAMYETHQRHPDHKTVIKVSHAFNVSIDYLFGETKIRTKVDQLIGQKSKSSIEVTEATTKMVDLFDWTEEEKQEAINYIGFLREKKGKA